MSRIAAVLEETHMSGELFSPVHLMVLLLIVVIVGGDVFAVLRMRKP
jgi:hypothetical protein